MATRTWTSNASTNMNLNTNYSGSGALLTTDDLVFNGTGSAVPVPTAALQVKSITVSSTASWNGSNFVVTADAWDFGGSGTITLVGANPTIPATATGAALIFRAGPTYTTTTGFPTINSAACAISVLTAVTVQRLITKTAGQVITWTPTAFTLAITATNASDIGLSAAYVEWKSSIPGTQYNVSFTGVPTTTFGLKITDCNNAASNLVNSSDPTNINGGNNTGFNIYQAISLVDPSLAATATDVNGGESWAKAMGTINRGSLCATAT